MCATEWQRSPTSSSKEGGFRRDAQGCCTRCACCGRGVVRGGPGGCPGVDKELEGQAAQARILLQDALVALCRRHVLKVKYAILGCTVVSSM